MKFFKFLKWWWNERTLDGKIGTVLIILLVSFVPASILFGIKGFFAVLSTLITLVVSGLLYLLWCLAKVQWDKYNKHIEEEEQRIVDRLRGHW